MASLTYSRGADGFVVVTDWMHQGSLTVVQSPDSDHLVNQQYLRWCVNRRETSAITDRTGNLMTDPKDTESQELSLGKKYAAGGLAQANQVPNFIGKARFRRRIDLGGSPSFLKQVNIC